MGEACPGTQWPAILDSSLKKKRVKGSREICHLYIHASTQARIHMHTCVCAHTRTHTHNTYIVVKYILKSKVQVGGMVLWIKCLLHKDEDPSFDPSTM